MHRITSLVVAVALATLGTAPGLSGCGRAASSAAADGGADDVAVPADALFPVDAVLPTDAALQTDAASSSLGPWPMPGQNPGRTRQSALAGPDLGPTTHLQPLVAAAAGTSFVMTTEPVICSEGRVYLAARVSAATADRVAAYTGAGTLLWERDMPAAVVGLACGQASTLYVLAQVSSPGGDQATAQLLRLGPTGDAIWSYPFTASSPTGFELGGSPDGSVLVSDGRSIYKLSASGALGWRREYPAGTRLYSWAVASDGALRLAFTGFLYVASLAADGTDSWTYWRQDIDVDSIRLVIGPDDSTIVAYAGLPPSGWVAREVRLDPAGQALWSSEMMVPTSVYSNEVRSVSLNGLDSCAQLVEDDSSRRYYRMYCYDSTGAPTPRFLVDRYPPAVDHRGTSYYLLHDSLTARNPDHALAGELAFSGTYEHALPDAGDSDSLLLFGPGEIARVIP